jgi:hypothetical protein
MIRVQYDETSGTPNTEAPPPRQVDESIAIMESIEETRETDQQRAEREAFLAALPEDVRREVLAQETAQKRRLSAYGRGELPEEPLPSPAPNAANAPLTQEQLDLLATLPAELRGEVERDMRAQNALQPPQAAPNAPRTPSRATPQAAPSHPSTQSNTSQGQEADLLGLYGVSYPTVSPTNSSNNQTASTSPSAPPMDMFQNLSVRGVTKGATNSRQQI